MAQLPVLADAMGDVVPKVGMPDSEVAMRRNANREHHNYFNIPNVFLVGEDFLGSGGLFW